MKEGVIKKFLMVIGFVVAGIGGAAAAGELPDNIKSIQKNLSEGEKPSEESE